MQPSHHAVYTPTADYGDYGAHHTGYGAAPVKPAAKTNGMPGIGKICVTCLLPWLVFVVIFSLESFSAHFYADTAITPLLLFGGLALVAVVALPAVQAQKAGDHPTALMQGVLALLTLGAVLGGIVLGEQVYEDCMRPYYDIKNSNDYHTVDPALYSGSQMMDAGIIEFTEGSYVDVSRSMAFRNNEMYCVAPIVSGNASAKVESYDFWAIGTNCCKGHSANFRCGEYNMVGAKSGLRLMRDDLRPFFRLAVQQAEAAFNFEARHPIFFYWMLDPDMEVVSYENAGYTQFLDGIYFGLILSFVVVLIAAVVSSKM